MDIPILFGRFLVRECKVSEEDLKEVTRVQSEINWSYATTAIGNDFITLEDLKKALTYQREKGIRFRDALTELKITDDETIKKIDDAHKENSVKLGELLVKKGMITKEALEEALTLFKEKGFK